ncbi:MAG: hypothetical protein A2275_06575 [Bacteroidetes bacterium RIFOXYA12_FULL_35_11]|nr:MAG: hypothetical protein A2X01_04075 [Bacteroidetes bacterium GWF2_35_48]OFY76739.1 MAG: hypothetical protein A2275_06575 [Bacteroidetes bacterium RIFOXYA12_FULL_35_11]OFY97802.1 MAG: hypothetical protein A2309_04640 [Bacteroidetes bacterium RIFOXYB2_FULL_35_7]OFZ06229.1 MAG: hypothetical protein A2491_13370 [Bacteroidetes bacterium RIFOXYC12_FULL_35_7]HBX52334.1 hypothetical protein [Bacteroidales bacterium]
MFGQIKLIKKYILLIVISFFFLPESFSQNTISFSAKIDSTKIIIGDQIKLTLTAKISGKQSVIFPPILDTITDKVEIVENLGIDTVYAENGYQILHQKYLITSFDSGIYVFRPFKIFFQEGNNKDSAFSKELYLQVFTVPIDTTKQAICDIKQQIETPFTLEEFIKRFYHLIIFAVVVILLGLLGWYLYRKYKKKEPIIKLPVKPKEAPHIVALRDLERIKAEKLWQKNMVKEYHSQLTEVLRVYIEGRFSINAMEQTTDEILQAFSNSALLDQRSHEVLRQILTIADFVKFAKAEPLPDENDLSLKNAFYFIDNTLMKVSLNIEKEENNDMNKN